MSIFQRYLALARWLALSLSLATNHSLAETQIAALPHEVEVNGVAFVLIPEGFFRYTVETGAVMREMQPGQSYNRHVSVWLNSFYLAKYEATAEDLLRFLHSSAASEQFKQAYRRLLIEDRDTEERFGSWRTLSLDNTGRFIIRAGDRQPANYLSWELANRFAIGMGFRLPTEAEWQKAARGIDNRIWPWGSIHGDDTYANFGIGRTGRPVSVDSYPRGRSPYGVYQMAGNVSEYVADWYNEEFDASLQDGVRDPKLAASGSKIPFDGPRRISKGGDWSPNITLLAIGFRNYVDPDRSTDRTGVRFALDASRVIEWLNSGMAIVPDQSVLTTTLQDKL